MRKYRNRTWISASPESVFEALDDPEIWGEIVPGILNPEVHEIDGDGYRLEYTYRLAGVRVKDILETIESEPGERHVFQLTGATTGRYAFDISEQGVGTRVEFTATYRLSNAILERALRRFAVRRNERQFDSMLENLKERLESQRRADADASADDETRAVA